MHNICGIVFFFSIFGMMVEIKNEGEKFISNFRGRYLLRLVHISMQIYKLVIDKYSFTRRENFVVDIAAYT